ncbi:hypothetical protein CDAR_212791 [Caerostris darwini]|uniref:Uncharacterized protein n=1 Tax=Caerostris darwini TaxID=1538125 RepID=A0AAV4RG44_9ARAC|nr:hypothetical protein CDAR_212791 [Caerostris darwini]
MTSLLCFSSCQFHEKQIFISYIILHFTSPCRHFSKGDFRNKLHLYKNGTLISRVFIECTVRMLYDFSGRRVDFLADLSLDEKAVIHSSFRFHQQCVSNMEQREFFRLKSEVDFQPSAIVKV